MSIYTWCWKGDSFTKERKKDCKNLIHPLQNNSAYKNWLGMGRCVSRFHFPAKQKLHLCKILNQDDCFWYLWLERYYPIEIFYPINKWFWKIMEEKNIKCFYTKNFLSEHILSLVGLALTQAFLNTPTKTQANNSKKPKILHNKDQFLSPKSC